MEPLYIDRWKNLLAHLQFSWVLFAHGTCVVVREQSENITQVAIDLIAQWPVHAGSNLGDFNIRELTDVPGWVITYAHPDIMTYLAPEEVEPPDKPDFFLGLMGRAKRNEDAHEQQVIFVHTATVKEH